MPFGETNAQMHTNAKSWKHPSTFAFRPLDLLVRAMRIIMVSQSWLSGFTCAWSPQNTSNNLPLAGSLLQESYQGTEQLCHDISRQDR